MTELGHEELEKKKIKLSEKDKRNVFTKVRIIQKVMLTFKRV